MAEPFIVMCAPNGARKTKSDHPELPITAVELADCAESILDAGASIIHVHVRDDDNQHSLDAGRYREATEAIRSRVDDQLIIQVTTEACGVYSPGEQMAMVRELRPEAVSLALKELCADELAEPDAAEFFAWLHNERIMPQFILYSAEEVRRFESLRERGVIGGESPFVLFVLGRYATNLTGDVSELDAFIDAVSNGTPWAGCCFGATEHLAVARAAALGGHARVGFENNLLMPDGSVSENNATLVSRAANAGRSEGRPAATADDVRARFGRGGGK